MTYRLSERQSKWLHSETTTGDQRAKFLSAGPAEAGTFMNMSGKSASQFYRPMVRGVIVSKETFDDAKKAQAEAETVRAKFASETEGIALDEIALGIDDRNRSIMDMCSDANIAIGTVLHMGAVLADPEVYGEELADLLDTLRDERPEAPIWRGLPTTILPNGDDGDDDEVAAEVLTDRLRSKGLFGFIVQIRTPVPTDFGEHGYGYSWGYSAHVLVYGETFENAVKQGAEWAEAFRETCRAKAAAASAK